MDKIRYVVFESAPYMIDIIDIIDMSPLVTR